MLPKQHVLWFDVTMDEPLLMGIIQRRGDLLDV